jgi:SPP1 gp7 family putative phage head morphogenesis protein
VGLHQRYARLLGDDPQTLSLSKEREEEIRKQLSELFDGMMNTLYSLEGSQFRIEVLADPKIQKFIDAHAGVLDSTFKKVEMSDGMRKRLQRSDYIFSGMKTFHELNEAFPSLLDSNGNRKTFEAFLNDVRKIDNTYNSNYLRAEYNFVQSSAEMAAKWEQFSEDGDRYNLQYRTANDGKVRPEHAALNGVTLPPSDPFWEEYYPPNGWNCRCTVVQVRKSKYPATPHDEAMALGEEALQRDTKGIFHFNPGKEDKTVPDYNPYTIRRCRDCDIAKGKIKLARFVPENELCAACKYLRTCLEHKYSDGFRNYKKEATNSVTAIDGKECANLQTGQFYQTKKSFKRGIAHAYTVEEVEMFETFKDYASRMTFVRHSPLGEVKNMTDPKDIANIQKKIHRGVTGYNVYEVTIGDELWELKTEVFKNKSETLYVAIRKG